MVSPDARSGNGPRSSNYAQPAGGVPRRDPLRPTVRGFRHRNRGHVAELTAREGRPRVLIIDDEPEDQRGFLGELEEFVEAEVVEPAAIAVDSLLISDLVLVDLQLKFWPEREVVSPGLQPWDGLAL